MGPFMVFAGPCDEATAAAVRRGLRGLQATLAARSRLVEDLELAATELVTNAVRAGAHRIEVELQIVSTQLELRISDDGPGVPAAKQPSLDRVDGRGLHIVAALADDWGYTLNVVSKTVWARFVG